MANILTFHNDVARTGTEFGPIGAGSWSKRYEVDIAERPAPADLDHEPDGRLSLWHPSAVRGAPLFLNKWIIENGPRHGQSVDMVIVATSDGEVFAYDHGVSRAGAPPPLLWKQSLSPSRYHIKVPSTNPSRPPISNIPRPIGITSTPVIDMVSRRLFVVACHQETGGSASYTIYALEIDTGTIVQSAVLVDPGTAGQIKFDAHGLDQRGGLTLLSGRVYIAFSDLYAYDAEDLPHPSGGWIVSCKATDLGHQRFFSATKTVHGGGIWAAGGVSADGSNRLYAATGTGLTGVTPAYWSDLNAHHQHPGDSGDFFMSVVQLAYDGDQLRLIGWYQPGPTGGTGHDIEWIENQDADLGSCSVLVLPPIAGRRFVLTSSKDGDAYLLDADKNLGHYDGHVDRVTIFPNEGEGAPALWRRKNGDAIVFLTGRQSLAAMKIAPPSSAGGHWITPLYARGFFSDLRLSTGNLAGSPVVAPIGGGPDDALVWVADPRSDPADADGAVYAIDAATGTVVFDSTRAASNSPGPMPHFPLLSAVGNFVFVGTKRGFVCYEFDNIAPTSIAPTSRRNFLQSNWGHQGNFELLVPQENLIKQYFRDNDNQFTWHHLRDFGYPSRPGQLGPSPRSITFIQSNFKGDGVHGNFEAIVRVAPPIATDPDRLDFWFLDSKTSQWKEVPLLVDGQPITNVTGDPVLIQSNWGHQGNFELLVPQGNLIKQYFRDNDNQFTWHHLRDFGYPSRPGQLGPSPRSITFIQSNFKGDGVHGNFEAIVRVAPPIATDPDRLDFWFLDSKTSQWKEVPLLVDGQPITNVTGDPVLIQSNWGHQGNFELLVPQGNLIKQYFRDNDNQFTWHHLRDFGYPSRPGQLGPSPRSITFIQSNFKGDGVHGNFEAIVRVAPPIATDPDRLDFWFLDSKTSQWKEVPLLVDGQPITNVTGN